MVPLTPVQGGTLRLSRVNTGADVDVEIMDRLLCGVVSSPPRHTPPSWMLKPMEFIPPFEARLLGLRPNE